jgi:hypothetical protein
MSAGKQGKRGLPLVAKRLCNSRLSQRDERAKRVTKSGAQGHPGYPADQIAGLRFVASG